MVDWSANSIPKLGRDSIWLAVVERRGRLTNCWDTAVTNVATRRGAEMMLRDLIAGAGSRTTLVGVDFSLGYPAGTAGALGLTGEPWPATWELLARRIADDERNVNNRFRVAAELNARIGPGPGPFWGCPPSARGITLESTKPAAFGRLGEWRLVEQTLRADGHRPFSSWQLLGAGAVGSQSLLGIPMVERLRSGFDDQVDIWPFTTEGAPPTLQAGAVVFAEVWPTLTPSGQAAHTVRDARQVDDTARWLADLAETGELEVLLALDLDVSSAARVVLEEGWVLGVTP